MIRVALVLGQRTASEAIAAWLSVEPDIRPVSVEPETRGEIPDLAAADVLVVDPEKIYAPLSGILYCHPQLNVVILTASFSELALQGAARLGVRCYLAEREPLAALVDAIRAAAAGESWLSRDAVEIMLENYKRMAESTTGLTPRQLDILQGVVVGKTNREIAADLCLAEKTIKNYMRGLFANLGAVDRTDAAIKGLQAGYVRGLGVA